MIKKIYMKTSERMDYFRIATDLNTKYCNIKHDGQPSTSSLGDIVELRIENITVCNKIIARGCYHKQSETIYIFDCDNTKLSDFKELIIEHYFLDKF